MNVFLLYENQNYDPGANILSHSETLEKDLEINSILDVMAADDNFLREKIRPLMYMPLQTPAQIHYRQAILRDCLKNPAALRQLYSLACKGAENKKSRRFIIFEDTPGRLLDGAVMDLDAFIPILEELALFAEKMQPVCTAPGWKKFFSLLQAELSSDYLKNMRRYIDELRFKNGILARTQPGAILQSSGYSPCRTNKSTDSGIWIWIKSFFKKTDPCRITVDARDESGNRILYDLKSAAVAQIAYTLAHSRDHIRSFFISLKTELAFYAGCLNLSEQLIGIGIPHVFPMPENARTNLFSCRELHNISLSLYLKGKTTANTIIADEKKFIIVTGANQGGKTTFLRSLGQAYLMMGCGMFVAASHFRASVSIVFTHFKQEEDNTLQSGKLAEELSRMNSLVDIIRPGNLILMNESFASTNEREGSEIASQIAEALSARDIRIVFVTHFYRFAEYFYQKNDPGNLFLRAERQDSGQRTFRLIAGKPLETSFGRDIYQKIFSG